MISSKCQKTFVFGLFFLFYSGLAYGMKFELPHTWLNLNVFDQQQGQWELGFRRVRLNPLQIYIKENLPDVVVLQEAKADDLDLIVDKYPFQNFVSEMSGADKFEYGYLIASKIPPQKFWSDGFSFPGGVSRKVQAAVWGKSNLECIGTLSLHWSYQNSKVRELEAAWLVDWLERAKNECKNWLVLGDFNADENSPEIKKLFSHNLNNLFTKLEPTIDPQNPIRAIYGKDFPPRTIDWALGFHFKARARVVLSQPYLDNWISDHSAVWVEQ